MAVQVRQEIDIENLVGPTIEVPRAVTGPFSVCREGTHCSAASTVCVPSTESLERTLYQLLASYSCLEVSATMRSQITSRLRCTQLWQTYQLLNSCLLWRLVRRPAVSYRFSAHSRFFNRARIFLHTYV